MVRGLGVEAQGLGFYRNRNGCNGRVEFSSASLPQNPLGRTLHIRGFGQRFWRLMWFRR